jgi:uncharacterized membrane protein YciS (DUF1049 family)
MKTSPAPLAPSPRTGQPRGPVHTDARSFWRIFLAVIVPLGPLSVGLALFLAAVDPAAGQFANLLTVYLIPPGVLALAWVVRRRTPVLATVGGSLAGVGYAALIQVPDLAVVGVAADAAGLSASTTDRLVTAVGEHPVSVLLITVYLVGHVLGLVLLGIALLRSQVGPRWLAITLIVAAPLDIVLGAASGSAALVAAGFVPLSIGFAAASVALLRTDDTGFDLPPGDVGPGDHDAQRDGNGIPRDLRRFWRITFAVLAPVAPLSIAILRFLLPYDTVDDAQTMVAKTLEAPEFSTLVVWSGIVTAVALVPGLLTVAWVTRRRLPVLTTVAFIVAYLGFGLLAGGGFPTDAVALAGARIGLDAGSLAAVLAAGTGTLAGAIGGVVFVVCHILGAVLLGAALVKSRAVPLWVGWVLIVSQPLHFVAAVILSSHALDLMAWGMTALGFAAAGVALLRTPSDRFDLAPLPRPVPE